RRPGWRARGRAGRRGGRDRAGQAPPRGAAELVAVSRRPGWRARGRAGRRGGRDRAGQAPPRGAAELVAVSRRPGWRARGRAGRRGGSDRAGRTGRRRARPIAALVAELKLDQEHVRGRLRALAKPHFGTMKYTSLANPVRMIAEGDHDKDLTGLLV